MDDDDYNDDISELLFTVDNYIYKFMNCTK